MESDRLTTIAFRIAATFGFTGVILGALGAHKFKAALVSFGTADVWSTAVSYQLVHAVALLALAASGRLSFWVAACWTLGVVLFSGSLYILAFTQFGWLGPITPLGGVALLAGWLILLIRGR